MRGFDLTGYKKIFNLATLAAAALLWVSPLYPQSLQSRTSDTGLLGLSGAVK